MEDERIVKFISEKLYKIRIDYDQKINSLKEITLKLKRKVSFLKKEYKKLRKIKSKSDKEESQIFDKNLLKDLENNLNSKEIAIDTTPEKKKKKIKTVIKKVLIKEDGTRELISSMKK